MQSVFVFIGKSEHFVRDYTHSKRYENCASKTFNLLEDISNENKIIIDYGKQLLKEDASASQSTASVNNMTDKEAFTMYYKKLAEHISNMSDLKQFERFDRAKNIIETQINNIRRYNPILKALYMVNPGDGHLVFRLTNPARTDGSDPQSLRGDISIIAERIRGNNVTGFITSMERIFWIGVESSDKISVTAGYYFKHSYPIIRIEKIVLKSVKIGKTEFETEFKIFVDTVLALTYFNSMLETIEKRIDSQIQ
jgi:hypothetical protein